MRMIFWLVFEIMCLEKKWEEGDEIMEIKMVEKLINGTKGIEMFGDWKMKNSEP